MCQRSFHKFSRLTANQLVAGSKAALVALVTPDVSQAGRALLAEVFTEVVEVPYIEAKYVQRHHLVLFF